MQCRGVTLAGEVAEAIVTEAERFGVGMIVVSRRYLTWMDRLLGPSICRGILERAHCTVLVNVVDSETCVKSKWASEPLVTL
jgi:nucleotide-binding universal stress UspA family protein